jgi:hypothetical protein
MAKKTKRIMREFALDEISAVNHPAQKGARMTIMKRDGEERTSGAVDHTMTAEKAAELNADIMKRGKYKLTTPNMGHTHLVDIDDWVLLAGGGTTSCVEYGGGHSGGSYHSHPFVIGPKGEITIGEVMGHTHEIADVPTMKAADNPASDGVTKTEEDEAMTPEQIAKMAELEALAGMNDTQKAFLAKLAGAERDAFLKADFPGRELLIAKASEGDPVVYKSAAGVEFRASAGAAMIAMAKQLDAATNALAVAEKARVDAEVEAIVKSLDHIGETIEKKREWATAIVALPDEAMRKSALEVLTKTRAAPSILFKSLGATGGTTVEPTDATGKLNKLAADLAAKENIGAHVAMDKVLKTVEGAALYQETQGHTGHPLH